MLVGHVRGAAGYNVFDHLDQLSLGDKVVASSRGQTYDFVVSQNGGATGGRHVADAVDAESRLTLMTCAGDWNPLTRDYSDRLWVIAEPPGRREGDDRQATDADTRAHSDHGHSRADLGGGWSR